IGALRSPVTMDVDEDRAFRRFEANAKLRRRSAIGLVQLKPDTTFGEVRLTHETMQSAWHDHEHDKPDGDQAEPHEVGDWWISPQQPLHCSRLRDGCGVSSFGFLSGASLVQLATPASITRWTCVFAAT